MIKNVREPLRPCLFQLFSSNLQIVHLLKPSKSQLATVGSYLSTNQCKCTIKVIQRAKVLTIMGTIKSIAWSWRCTSCNYSELQIYVTIYNTTGQLLALVNHLPWMLIDQCVIQTQNVCMCLRKKNWYCCNYNVQYPCSPQQTQEHAIGLYLAINAKNFRYSKIKDWT